MSDACLADGSSRYLSPEPLLQNPRWVKRMAKRGYSTPTYAYALNNPIRYTDRDGLMPGGALWWPAAEAAGPLLGPLVATGVGYGMAAGVGVVGAAGVVGTVWVGVGQFPDPGAGIPFPITPSIPLPRPHAPSEPGCPALPRWKPDAVPFPEIQNWQNCQQYWRDVYEACLKAQPWEAQECMIIADEAEALCLRTSPN